MSKPMFQKRHYEAVAEQLKWLKTSSLVTVTDHTLEVWKTTVRYMSNMFEMDNAMFKRDKFRAACGMEE